MAHSEWVLAQFGGGGGGNPTVTLIFFVGIFAIMYFLMIRPQQKQLKDHRDLLASLKKGDEVVTQGGVLGRISAISDKVVTVEVASGVKLRVLKTAVQAKGATADEVAAKSEDKKSDEKKEEA